MTKRLSFLIWLVSLFTVSAVAEAYPSPGYMDSYYYYHVAANLARGRGMVEDFIWSYLAPPAGIPHPANLYWMPLASWLAAPFLATLGISFRVAQLPFIFLASLAPLVTAGLAWQLLRDQRLATSAALLTLFAGFYLSYWPAVDSFGSFALAATAALLAAGWMLRSTTAPAPVEGPPLQPWAPSRNGQRPQGWPSLLSTALGRVLSRRRVLSSPERAQPAAGGLSGPVPLAAPFGSLLVLAVGCGTAIALAHLARADGVLLLGVVFLLALGHRPRRVALALALVVVASYLAVMGPWFLRNAMLTGYPLSVAGVHTVWLRSYDDLFRFLEQPAPAAFLEWGWTNILWSRSAALAQNLSVFFGGAFHLAPFAAIGLWSLRHRLEFRPFLVYAALLYLVHSLVFAFPGPRGSLLHSGVALLPWLAVASVVGLDRAVAWAGARLPHWNVPRAQRNFGVLVLVGCGLLGIFFTVRNAALWTQDFTRYLQLTAWAQDHTPPDALLLVTNPPAFTYVSGRPSLATPSDGVEGVLAAADRYGAAFLALEIDHARSLDLLYQGEETHPRLKPIADVGPTRVFAIAPPQARTGASPSSLPGSP